MESNTNSDNILKSGSHRPLPVLVPATQSTQPATENTTATPPKVFKSYKRPHTKSHRGCVHCKRRKVKCDEAKPICANCLRFTLPCSFSTDSTGATAATAATAAPTSESKSSPAPLTAKRRRGRPRRDWTLPETELIRAKSPLHPSPCAVGASFALDTVLGSVPSSSQSLSQVELFYHFKTQTAPTLGRSDKEDNAIARFWAQNVLQIALEYPFVLHLAFSLAAIHIKCRGSQDAASQSRYLSLARTESTLGLAGLNNALHQFNNNNCGAIYVSTILECLRIFAAGPTGPDDLLICARGKNSAPERWLPIARGTRLIHDIVQPDVLFSGLMAPLSPKKPPYVEPTNTSPVVIKGGPSWVDWAGHMDKLRRSIDLQHDEHTAVRRTSFDCVNLIYEAMFGDENGVFLGPSMYRYVLMWIYFTDDAFVSLLLLKDPLALLILAYYAPLLKVDERDWFLNGWAEHLNTTARSLVRSSHEHLLAWPSDLMARLDSRRHVLAGP